MSDASKSSEGKLVKVDLHFTGGHQVTTKLPSDSPLLRNLLVTLAQRCRPSDAIFIQLPLDDGRAACSFSSAQLAYVVTDPAVLLETETASSAGAAPSTPATQPGGTARTTQPDHGEVADQGPKHRPPQVVVEDFLTPDEQFALLRYTLERENKFESSTVTTNDPDYRKGRILNEFALSPLSSLFLKRFHVHLPHVLRRLQIESFPIETIELQLTAHNDGDYFKVHNDAGERRLTSRRQLTFVYYFARGPGLFSGGDLRVYDYRIIDNRRVRAESFERIPPRTNSLLAFPSWAPHEVLTTNCPSREFRDSRFTITGWVRKMPDEPSR